jgi:4-hydroxy-2-oxoheptanedioate aldolase
LINSKEEAERFVFESRYNTSVWPRNGGRSFGPTRPLTLATGSNPTPTSYEVNLEQLRTVNSSIATFAMIETKQALESCEDIIKTPGLTGVFLGPLDLSISLGYDPKPEPDVPEVVSAMNHVLNRCHAHGKKAALFCGSGLGASKASAAGWDLVFPGADISMLAGAAKNALLAAKVTQ